MIIQCQNNVLSLKNMILQLLWELNLQQSATGEKELKKEEEKIACRGAIENSPAHCKQAICIFKEKEKAIRDF